MFRANPEPNLINYNTFFLNSPLFCCFELLGLMLSFLSASSFSDAPGEIICSLRPIFMSVSFVLVLGNIIAKTFRIYRIFDNSFAFKPSMVNNRYLVTIVIGLLCVVLVIVGLWLILDPPVPMLRPADSLSSFWTCNSRNIDEGGVSIFEILLLIYAGMLVTCASFLAYKVKSIDNNCKILSSNDFFFYIYIVLFYII